MNEAEERLRQMLARAGFPQGEWHHQIMLGRPLGSTSPHVFFAGDEADEPGTCVYLDGLSAHIHRNPDTREKDQAIRNELRSRHYEVFEIPATHLFDREQMATHFFRLARVLMDKDRAREVKEQRGWFESTAGEPSSSAAAPTSAGADPTTGFVTTDDEPLPHVAESEGENPAGGGGKSRKGNEV